MLASATPRIEVLGAYLLTANHEQYEQYERCVAEYVALCDPANLSPSMHEFFLKHGRNVDDGFNADDFVVQPDPDLPGGAVAGRVESDLPFTPFQLRAAVLSCRATHA